VEVTAGTSLFQVVVDNDATATKILDIMIKERSGRVTFMPLNRLKEQTVEYPTGKDAVVMFVLFLFPRPLVLTLLDCRIKKLTFDKKFHLAFAQVFGKTIICQTLEIAGAYTRTHDLNTITLDGDKYDRKGSLTGGFHDARRSRLDAIKQLKFWQVKYEEEVRVAKETKEVLTRLDQEITQGVGKIQVVMGRRERLETEREPMVSELLGLQADESTTRGRIARLHKAAEDSTADVQNLGLEIEAYERELKTKMEQKLSDAELAQVAVLNDQVDTIRKSLVELSKSTSKVSPIPVCPSPGRELMRSSTARGEEGSVRDRSQRESPTTPRGVAIQDRFVRCEWDPERFERGRRASQAGSQELLQDDWRPHRQARRFVPSLPHRGDILTTLVSYRYRCGGGIPQRSSSRPRKGSREDGPPARRRRSQPWSTAEERRAIPCQACDAQREEGRVQQEHQGSGSLA
jgi:hypothetical protein